MVFKTRLLFFTTALLLVVLSQGHAEILGDYVGYKACMPCHEEVAQGWKTTPHAHAFETLKEQGEEKQSLPGCIKCHVVGYEEDGGFVDMSLTPELADVQCENCHGPARKHVDSEGDPGQLTTRADEASCRRCHTEGQDKNFDFAQKSQWVHQAETKSIKSAKHKAASTAGLTLSDTRIPFGNMTEGEVVKKRVTLTNTGKEVIHITNVTTS